MPGDPTSRGQDRSIDYGLVLLVLLLLLVPLLIWFLVANWQGSAEDSGSQTIQMIDSEAVQTGHARARRIARQAGARNPKIYRRRLALELAKENLELRRALNQARLDPQSATHAQWQALIDQRRAQVQAASKRLTDFESLLEK